MKTIKLISATKKIFLGVLTTIILFSFTSCSRKITFLVSSVVPAARGTVEVSTDKNKNFLINLQVSNLAEVERLQPPRKVYVVWLVIEQGLTKNIGQIKSSSSKLTGSLETVSSFKPIKVFITAEDDTEVQIPGEMLVMSTDNF